ncbi:hypothetical protein ACYZT7_10360 [Pseudomonas sp. RT4P38]
MKNGRLIIFMALACWFNGHTYGSDIDSQAGAGIDPELIKLLKPERFAKSTSWQNWHEISVSPVYVPDPPGQHGVVGTYECPLMNSDRDQLREITTSYFIAHGLQILFDKGDDNLAVVIALKNTEGTSKFIAYRARMDIKIFPETPTQGGISKCDILFSAHRISGEIKEGKRNLNGAAFTDDEVTQGLMEAFRSFASKASERPPRQSNNPFIKFFGL